MLAAEYSPSHRSHSCEADSIRVMLSLVYDGGIPLQSYKRCIQGDSALESIFCNTAQVDRALNIITTKAARKDAPDDFATIQRGENRCYLKAGAEDPGHGRITNRGYFLTVKPAMGSAMLNVSITMGIFLKPILLSDFMESFGTKNFGKLGLALKGVMVHIDYTRGKDNETKINSEERRIKNIWSFKLSVGLQTFKIDAYEETTSISIKTYLEKTYSLVVSKSHPFCVNLGGTKGNES
ncbi:hypothetical protein AOQ84DRAFT_227163 [Glonium stellatum]|uniref:Uncharacterized protein n=1 Tax=Glonium stellatum TaxID=574774 RepID=A0A8E2ERX8_9PEZI|nr:hypothetical protein AOQ84DRAFT_227163 [Glonium stellatum]